jgi:hypothetical protein
LANPVPVAAQSAKAIVQTLVVIFQLAFEVTVFSATFRIGIPSHRQCWKTPGFSTHDRRLSSAAITIVMLRCGVVPSVSLEYHYGDYNGY